MKKLIGLSILALLSGVVLAAESPDWAYPVTPKPETPDSVQMKSVPGSSQHYTQAQIDDPFNPPDWFPDEHPKMPEIVAHGGQKPAGRACAQCHLPTGDGHPESAGLAGLPAEYIRRQMATFKTGQRANARAGVMIAMAPVLTDEEVKAAADYFSRLKPTPGFNKVVETDTVPKSVVGAGGMRFVVPDGGKEPIGDRIIVLPMDENEAKLRDPHSGFIDYVPTGSIAKGQALVTTGGDGKTIQCAGCHGPDLKGSGEVPSIAGKTATYIFRQLNDIQAGARNGVGVAFMKPAVANLTQSDMIALAAYLEFPRTVMEGFANLGDLIQRDRDLTKVAVIDLGGEQSPREFTFTQLDAMANGVARTLARRGYARGDRVAILSANRAEYLAAYYGIMRAGLVAVPVNFKFPRQTIHFIVRDAGAKLVFCDDARRVDCPPDVPRVTFGAEFDAFIDAGPFNAIVPAPDEPAMFLYTSGSTGTPKGVVLSHQSHIWVVRARLAPGLERHRYLIAAPLYHMNALALSLLACAAHAGIVLLPQFSAGAYIGAIGRYRCTWLTAVPPMIAMMLRETDLMAHADLSSVEFVRMGSAPVSQSLMQALHRALPHASVTNAYGTTEAGPVVFGPHPKGLPQPEMSVGYPHPQVQVRLVDGANRDADEGVLEMKCPAIMLGYHNRPSPSPASGEGEGTGPITADGFYITGDVFRRDADGFHYFVGRTDDMFVSGGENIYPADVERMLERHPDVAQAAVVPIDDEIKGSKPVAFVIRKAGGALDADAVKRFALANAPAYQHPRFVWFVDDLPLASTNKLDRAALHAMAERRIAEAPDDSVLSHRD